MAAALRNPIFQDDNLAREWLEARVWPDGPVCPHCGAPHEFVTKLEGEAHRAGLYQCNQCREQFTVTVGTLFERSKIPLSKWLLAVYLISASKKGMSSLQLSRMLGISYKSTWFMMHRIREAMADPSSPIGGQNKTVEIDETYVGGKAHNRKGKVPKKIAVVALVERGGEVRAGKVKRVNSKTLRPLIVSKVSRKSAIMTDESVVYPKIGEEFANHGSVNHSAQEYARGGYWHTNTVENYFSILKRGVIGTYHHWSEQHLDRYVGEFSFRYNNRGVSDMERAEKLAEGIKGKRLTYRRTDEARHA